MRLVTFAAHGADRAGVVAQDGTVVAARDLVRDAPDDVIGVIAAGERTWRALADAAAKARGGTPLERAKLRAPIPRPRRNVFCVGWNYFSHFAEGEGKRGPNAPKEMPEHPSFFTKNPNTVVGPDASIRHSAPLSEQIDWEVELAVVIGRGGIDIRERDALSHVFGYTVGNDVSVRDVQMKWHGGQWFKGKNLDTHLPLGPWIVTADELPDPQNLRLCTRVNGVTKQDSSTGHMVFSVARIIEELSAGLTLEPGDVIMSGTPEGVGTYRVPQEFMKVGDTVEVEIERIGTLRNTIQSRA
jgi:2-keto-4-pentenoate hydratase/2-oxohepta-3-ene-1,7-dioic acid hydratase in catechol pathway